MPGRMLLAGPLGDLAGWVTDIVHNFGYLGVGVLTALENLVPPIPSELILPLAGFLAGQGRFNLPLAIVASVAGSLAGALVLYALGYWLGEERLRHLVKNYGRWLLIGESDLDKAKGWFQNHGHLAVVLARVIPGARSFISVPAGVEHMPLPLFILYTTIGSTVWNTALVLLGWGLGSQWQKVEEYAQYLEYGALALLVAGIGWFVWQRKFKKSSDGSGEHRPMETEQPGKAS